MPNLYEITESTKQALDEVLTLEDVPQEAINDTIEGLTGELEVKQTNVAAYVLNLNSDVQAMKEYNNKMVTRIKQKERLIEKLKSSLLWSFLRTGIKKVESAELTVSLRKNPPKVVINNESLIPDEFIKTKMVIDIDKSSIKKALLNGKDVSGAHLESSERIDIK